MCATQISPALTARRRRHILGKRRADDPWDIMANSPSYIDAIGVPRGVPNQYKLADEIAAGFENIPLLSALVLITQNKNVDRINYIHYNVLRLANITRDAVECLAEQLAPTSLKAVQNRMALDMLLAEKGGVCSMFGSMCCTFVPNHTSPDGKVTRALHELHALSETMHEHSGISNPIGDWMTRTFSQWKGLITSLVVSLGVFIGILVTFGCCCIPCIRSLCLKLITIAIEGKVLDQTSMMPLLATAEDCQDSEVVLEATY